MSLIPVRERVAEGLLGGEQLGGGHDGEVGNVYKQVAQSDERNPDANHNRKVAHGILQLFGHEIELIPSVETPHSYERMSEKGVDLIDAYRCKWRSPTC